MPYHCNRQIIFTEPLLNFLQIAVMQAGIDVTVRDVRGSCPQNMILLAIFGDTAAVEAAVEQIRSDTDSN